MADVFVSYSRQDKKFVSRLFAALEARGKDVWVDWDDIPPTADWLAHIRSGLAEANDFIFVVSPDSIGSEVCATELQVAEELNKRIVPVLLREVDPDQAPEAVARHNWIFFDDPGRFDESVETLVEALETDLEHVQAHTRLLIQAQRWEREGRNRSLLIRGTELTAAEAWLDAAPAENKQPAPLPLQAEFIRGSRESAERRQRLTVGAVSLALVVAIALAIVALVQRSNAIDQRNAATARQLDAEAQNRYDTDPELSVLLAAEAAEIDPGEATREALRQALGRSHLIATYHSPTGQPTNAQFSPRSDALLIADGDDTARIRVPGQPGPPIELEAPGSVNQIAWSGDGSAVATGGAEPTVWDARTGEAIMTFPPAIRAFSISLDEPARRVAIMDPEGVGHVFTVPGGQEVATFRGPGGGPGLCFEITLDASLVAQCDQAAGAVHVWEADTGELERTVPVPHGSPIGDLAADGRVLGVASGGTFERDGTIRLVRTADGRTVFSGNDAVSAVVLSPVSDDRLAFTRTPSLADVTAADSGRDVPLVGHTDRIDALAFGLGDSRIVTGSLDRTARIFETSGGEQVELLAGHRDRITSVTYSHDGTLVATTSEDGDTRVWATDKPRPEVSVPHPRQAPAALEADPGGSGRLLYAGAGPTVEILDPETLEPEGSVPLPAGDEVLAAEWAADGSLFAVATAHEGGTPTLLAADPDRPAAATPIRPQDGLANAATVAGGRVATISRGGELQLWDGLAGESIRAYDVEIDPQAAIGASRTGERLAVLNPDGEISVLDTDGGEVVQTIDGPRPRNQALRTPPVSGLAFDPSGQRLASYGGDRAVRLWDVETGELLRTLKGGQSFFGSVVFSPDGALIAGGDANGVYVWDADSGAVVNHLQHADPGTWGTIVRLGLFEVTPRFSADGETLVTTGDAQVAVWSPRTGQRLFLNPFASVGDVSHDGHTIYTGGPTTLDSYPCSLCGGLDDLLDYARESVTRDLTEAERERFLPD